MLLLETYNILMYVIRALNEALILRKINLSNPYFIAHAGHESVFIAVL